MFGSHSQWADTLNTHADNCEHPDDAEYWRYYADQHTNADNRENGTGCPQDQR